MALPTSGNIKLSEIKTEFSGGNDLTDYYRAGANVKDYIINDGIPKTGNLKITDFYTAAKYRALVAGNTGTYPNIGYKSGYDSGTYGTLDITDVLGDTITMVRSEIIFIFSTVYRFSLEINDATLTQNGVFTQMEVTGVFDGGGGARTQTFTSSSASFIAGSGISTWNWFASGLSDIMVNGNTYEVGLTVV